MLYSSCKSRLLEEVVRDYHLEIAKKVWDGENGWKAVNYILRTSAVTLYGFNVFSLEIFVL